MNWEAAAKGIELAFDDQLDDIEQPQAWFDFTHAMWVPREFANSHIGDSEQCHHSMNRLAIGEYTDFDYEVNMRSASEN